MSYLGKYAKRVIWVMPHLFRPARHGAYVCACGQSLAPGEAALLS